MRVLHGKPVSPGYAEGRAFVYTRRYEPPPPRYRIEPEQVSEEHLRFYEALGKSSEELFNLRQRVLSELGRAESEIFATHLALVKDPQFVNKVKDRIGRDLVNVEHALDVEVGDLMRLLSELENEYMQERAADVKDVGERVLKHLGHGPQEALYSVPPGSVVVAEDLLPSDTLNMDRAHVVGIVTEFGGSTSHMAILSRSLGIPAVSGIADVCREIPQGSDVLVDGTGGTVTLGPTAELRDEFLAVQERYDHQNLKMVREEGKECVTLDGTRITLLANIGRSDEASEVRRHNLDGVGLFRTEYLFIESPEPPDLQMQIAAYEEVARELEGLPVVIRTLDLGADKKPLFPVPLLEDDSMLGNRGLRFSLIEGNLLATQLQAIAEVAGRHEQMTVLFPMVIGAGDLKEAINRLKEMVARSGSEKMPSVGAMIEAPSSLFELEEILALVDFVSLGTNDLAQFMLAADRYAVDLLGEEAILHPSVLRAIRRVVEAANERNHPVSVCGEAAGHPALAALLVGLGIRELSMASRRAARVRYALRRHRLGDLEDFARQALRNDSPQKNASLLEEITQMVGVPDDSGT